MTIVCFEGPSAVGKTTTARALSASNGIDVVSEVATLFERPSDEPADWYLERQVERWRRALEASRDRDVVLDGDPFQPLWYNWAYDFEGCHSLDQLAAFYRPRLVRRELAFPNLYVLFTASGDVLRLRKASDPARTRRNFERHLRFIVPQQRYFAMMQRLSPGLVLLVSSDSIQDNTTTVADAFRFPRSRPDDLSLFDALVDWLRGTPSL